MPNNRVLNVLSSYFKDMINIHLYSQWPNQVCLIGYMTKLLFLRVLRMWLQNHILLKYVTMAMLQREPYNSGVLSERYMSLNKLSITCIIDSQLNSATDLDGQIACNYEVLNYHFLANLVIFLAVVNLLKRYIGITITRLKLCLMLVNIYDLF